MGKLAELAAQSPVIQETFAQASQALCYDLWVLTQQGPETELNQTDKTQPAILTASIALWRLWLAEGGARPAFVAGHRCYGLRANLKERIDIEGLPNRGKRKRQDLKCGYQRTRILESLPSDIDSIQCRVE